MSARTAESALILESDANVRTKKISNKRNGRRKEPMKTEATPSIIAATIPPSTSKTLCTFTVEAARRAFSNPEILKEYKEWEKKRKKSQKST